MAPRNFSKQSEAKAFAVVNANSPPGQPQEIPLANIRASDNIARPWLITLGKVDRTDRADMTSPGGVYGTITLNDTNGTNKLSGGYQNAPVFPPKRATYPYDGSVFPPFVNRVLLKWTMDNNGTALANQLIADWPMLGSSFVVTASSVDVIAVGGVFGRIPNANEVPSFKAQISPANALNNDTSTLILTQNGVQITNMKLTAPTVAYGLGGHAFYVPDFARKVKVVLTRNYYGGGAPFIAQQGYWNDPDAQGVVNFWDDYGNIVDSHYIAQISQAQVWINVPPRATMMGIYSLTAAAVDTYQACVNWQIVPN
jgi:hypothetical protein